MWSRNSAGRARIATALGHVERPQRLAAFVASRQHGRQAENADDLEETLTLHDIETAAGLACSLQGLIALRHHGNARQRIRGAQRDGKGSISSGSGPGRANRDALTPRNQWSEWQDLNFPLSP